MPLLSSKALGLNFKYILGVRRVWVTNQVTKDDYMKQCFMPRFCNWMYKQIVLKLESSMKIFYMLRPFYVYVLSFICSGLQGKSEVWLKASSADPVNSLRKNMINHRKKVLIPVNLREISLRQKLSSCLILWSTEKKYLKKLKYRE